MTLPTHLFKLYSAAVRSATTTTDLAKVPLGQIVKGKSIQSCNYCAVSHVWGKPKSVQVANVPWTVPILGADKLLFILKACERRGYEYVWMDVLCVDQTRESPGDKNREVASMYRYYKNAHATMVFGTDWEHFASYWAKVDVLVKWWNGDSEKVIDPNWSGLGDIDTLIKDEWFSRVWTLQETVVPLTTTPFDTAVTNPPYSRIRLLTSDGAPIDIRGLCDLIDWTYIALAKLAYTATPGTYSWIHPGAGVVNDNGWWTKAVLNEAIRLGPTPLHPIQAMQLTRYRNTTYDVDRIRGVYALIDEEWQSVATDPIVVFKELGEKYIKEKEGALLVTMGVGQKTRTWAAAVDPTSSFGSFVAPSGDYPLISATINFKDNTLLLKAAGLIEISVKGDKQYGDGSGELNRLTTDLENLHVDTSSIVILLKLAATQFQITTPLDTLKLIQSFLDAEISNANSLSSALREVFAGWNRWIITFPISDSKSMAALAWLPFHDAKAVEAPTYSLLWLKNGVNQWAVIVEGDMKKGCKKVGVAFVNSVPMGQVTDTILL